MLNCTFTHFSMKQFLRTPGKMSLHFALFAATAMFLCLGLNLHQYAAENLDAVYNAFDITAVPDFKGNINSVGEMCEDINSNDYIGYYSCQAENYDLLPLTQLEGVIDYDIRNQFGAYVSNASAKMFRACTNFSIKEYNRAKVICFTPASSQGATIPTKGDAYIPVYVKWAAARESDSPESVIQQLKIRNYYEQEYTLEPGKEYIAVLGYFCGAGEDVYHLTDDPEGNVRFRVSSNGVYYMEDTWHSRLPFSWFTENYDGFWQTEMGDYYRQIAEAVEYSAYSLTAVTVNRLDGISAFSENRVWVSRGRDFTEEEIESGAKVCLVSRWMADHMEWKVGDTLDLNFFPCDYLYTAGDYAQYSVCRQDTIEASPIYHYEEADYPSQYHDFPSMHIFDQGEYEIIGIYDGLLGCGRDGTAVPCEDGAICDNTAGKGVYILNVYIPSNSVANQPTPKLSENNTTLWINPKKLLDFQAALESSGLTAKQETGYTMNVTVYDHNLSQLAPGLESLSQISKLILVLSGLTALLTVVAFAVLYMVQNKRQIAAFRAIGMSKRQVAVLLLFAVLLVCILGAGAGAFAGQKISASVTQSILETAAENRSDPSFSATLADADEEAEAFTYLEQENPLFPIFTWAGISLTLILAMLICFANESKKSPMLLLGTKE